MQSALVALNSKFRAGDLLPKIQREIINGKKFHVDTRRWEGKNM